MNRRNFAFDKANFILLAAGMIIVLLGFILMSGSGSTEHAFNPDIFSARRIKVAPIVCLAGFIFMIFAILHYPKNGDENDKIIDAANKATASDPLKK
ncbi:MAG: DUF3098 domain-containing protein [Bacteroidaceae bacterium]|jgi:hypothetical protein|nr:DUF3098 domain-containing protein [Bacteroidaceae bacterium]